MGLNLNIKHNNTDITNITSGSITLNTADKYCLDNLNFTLSGVEYWEGDLATYTQLAYIQDNGYLHVILPIQPKSGYSAELKFQFTGEKWSDNEQWMLDCWGGSVAGSWRCGYVNWGSKWWLESCFDSYSAGTSGHWTDLQIANGTLTYDVNTNIGLFGAGMQYRNTFAKFYYIKIWDENSNLIFDGLPYMQDWTQTPGILNLVDNQFYTTYGSTPFLYGTL